MKLLEKIKTRIDSRIRPMLISLFSGLLLIGGWSALNQAKAETNTPDLKTTGSTTGNTTTADVPKKASGPYKDGTFQASSPTPWGDYNISIEINNGYWVNVNNIIIPDSPPSNFAATRLAKQALLAQSAAIDGVSGATYTSDAFRDDLNQIVQQSKL